MYYNHRIKVESLSTYLTFSTVLIIIDRRFLVNQAKSKVSPHRSSGKSFMRILNNNGPNLGPWETLESVLYRINRM